LDGTPYSLPQRFLSEGTLPNFQKLVTQGNLRPLISVQPPLSSVAWASFMTGARPAEHGISGFVERNPGTLEWFVPRADHLQRPTIFKRLSEAGKRIFVMNVPLTSPPQKSME
jgi:predicted AlkP superfamily phosphohydrolase/phosphomutase